MYAHRIMLTKANAHKFPRLKAMLEKYSVPYKVQGGQTVIKKHNCKTRNLVSYVFIKESKEKPEYLAKEIERIMHR
ncbi:MAG: hypothetical protein E7508_07070 [Ruminococcus sp.]|nr:hypothetical protein [Ruminococcus sp.]